jgi:hypothetical protein
MMPLDIPLTLVADLSEQLNGHKAISVSIGPSGEAIILLVSDLASSEGIGKKPSSQTFLNTSILAPYAGTVLIHDGNRIKKAAISDITLADPFVQLLPGNEVLLVGARCRCYENGRTEHNAYIFDFNGQLKRKLLFGDGIADVQVGADGDIWVSYFDEGVFGNSGWINGGNELPVSSAGLVRFDTYGNVKWQYRPPAGFLSIVDCYALNVAENATWAYYYTDFTLVKVNSDDHIDGWQTGIFGARAVAIDDGRVLLFGGYSSERNRCVLAELGQTALINKRECRLMLPTGEQPSDRFVIGRGTMLHVFVGSQWYRIDIRTL